MHNTPFDILFTPIQIGPVTAPNRFYQVPHCNGMGYRYPRAHAAMRGVKAEGGWSVVCTEEVEIHHSSDLSPYIEGRIWDDRDIPPHALFTAAVHQHGGLAGIELVYSGIHAANLYSRVAPLGPRSMGLSYASPGQTRRMDKEDFKRVREWHRQAALRAKQAGYDIIYCYAGHDLSLAMHMMLKRYNDRTDEYGGSLQNRVRFFRELIEDTKEAVGDTCAVAARLAVEELLGEDGLTHEGEGYEIVAMLAELPDLWDVNISAWYNDSMTSRFAKEGYQEKYIKFVKTLTSKPVVGVGRYTSPEAMVRVIEEGIMDMVGAARPSIADPFLPEKIRQGRVEDIRECIGCNICVTGDLQGVPVRCTQNPTMAEEWRRGWHPERVPPKKHDKQILVVGGGPAGLECARALGERGYEVVLLEARREFGGRLALETELPGLGEWRRALDWRMTQIEKLPHVSLYPSSQMDATQVLETGFKDVIVATGAHWRRDGIGRALWRSPAGLDQAHIYTPDDLLAGQLPTGQVVIFDDDHYYMGSLLAELLADQGAAVTLVTPENLVSQWSTKTMEQERIVRRLAGKGVQMLTQHNLTSLSASNARFAHTLLDTHTELAADAIVLLTDRQPNDKLYYDLKPHLASGALDSLRLIGDAEAPHIIAQAIYSGYQAALEFDEPITDSTPFKREHIEYK